MPIDADYFAAYLARYKSSTFRELAEAQAVLVRRFEAEGASVEVVARLRSVGPLHFSVVASDYENGRDKAAIETLMLSDEAFAAAWAELYNRPQQQLKEDIAAYEAIKAAAAVKGKSGKILSLGLYALRGENPSHPDVGMYGKFSTTMLDVRYLGNKYDNVHEEFFLYLNGHFDDPSRDDYAKIKEIGIPLEFSSPDEMNLLHVPIPAAYQQRISAYLEADDGLDGADALTVYQNIHHPPKDKNERLGGTFSPIGMAKMLFDLGVLTGTRFRRVQINLLSCEIGDLTFNTASGQPIHGKLGLDFAKAIAALSGALSAERAADIVSALSALSSSDNAVSDSTAIKETRKRLPSLLADWPPGLQVEIRIPNHVYVIQDTGHKLYMLDRSDSSVKTLKSAMTEEQQLKIKTNYHVLPSRALLTVSSAADVDVPLADAKERLYVSERWGIDPDKVLGPNKSLNFGKEDGAIEVIRRKDDVAQCRVVKMREDFSGPLQDAKGNVEVLNVRSKLLVEPDVDAGGVGQRYAVKIQNKRPVFTRVNAPIRPDVAPAPEVSLPIRVPAESLPQRLADKLKVDPGHLDLFLQDPNLDVLFQASKQIKEAYPISYGECQLMVAHYDADTAYLHQLFPPTFPEKRVIAVSRARYGEALSSLSENELLSCKAAEINDRAVLVFEKYDDHLEQPLMRQSRMDLQDQAKNDLAARLAGEWDVAKAEAAAGIAVLSDWQRYLMTDAVVLNPQFAPLREMITASLARVTRCQAILSDESFDPDRLWDIKSTMRQEREQYVDNALMKVALPAEKSSQSRQASVVIHTIGADMAQRIQAYVEGRADDELSELETAAKAVGMVNDNGRGNIERYIRLIADRGTLTHANVDDREAVGEETVLFWPHVPTPYRASAVATLQPGPVNASYQHAAGEPVLSLILNRTHQGEIRGAHMIGADNADLQKLYGAPKSPGRLAPSILDDGAVIEDTAKQVFPSGTPVVLSEAQQQLLKNGGRLEFVIDPTGALRLGADAVRLMAGEAACIGGEVLWDKDENCYCLTNRSPYSAYSSRSVTQLKNVLPFFNRPQQRTITRWFRYKGKQFADEATNVAKPLFSTFLLPQTAATQPRPMVFPTINLEQRIGEADIAAARDLMANRSLFSDGGKAYANLLSIVIDYLDHEELSLYVDVLGDGLAQLKGKQPALLQEINEQTRDQFIEDANERLSLAAKRFTNEIYPETRRRELSGVTAMYIELARGFGQHLDSKHCQGACDQMLVDFTSRVHAGIEFRQVIAFIGTFKDVVQTRLGEEDLLLACLQRYLPQEEALEPASRITLDEFGVEDIGLLKSLRLFLNSRAQKTPLNRPLVRRIKDTLRLEQKLKDLDKALQAQAAPTPVEAEQPAAAPSPHDTPSPANGEEPALPSGLADEAFIAAFILALQTPDAAKLTDLIQQAINKGWIQSRDEDTIAAWLIQHRQGNDFVTEKYGADISKAVANLDAKLASNIEPLADKAALCARGLNSVCSARDSGKAGPKFEAQWDKFLKERGLNPVRNQLNGLKARCLADPTIDIALTDTLAAIKRKLLLATEREIKTRKLSAFLGQEFGLVIRPPVATPSPAASIGTPPLDPVLPPPAAAPFDIDAAVGEITALLPADNHALITATLLKTMAQPGDSAPFIERLAADPAWRTWLDQWPSLSRKKAVFAEKKYAWTLPPMTTAEKATCLAIIQTYLPTLPSPDHRQGASFFDTYLDESIESAYPDFRFICRLTTIALLDGLNEHHITRLDSLDDIGDRLAQRYEARMFTQATGEYLAELRNRQAALDVIHAIDKTKEAADHQALKDALIRFFHREDGHPLNRPIVRLTNDIVRQKKWPFFAKGLVSLIAESAPAERLNQAKAELDFYEEGRSLLHNKLSFASPQVHEACWQVMIDAIAEDGVCQWDRLPAALLTLITDQQKQKIHFLVAIQRDLFAAAGFPADFDVQRKRAVGDKVAQKIAALRVHWAASALRSLADVLTDTQGAEKLTVEEEAETHAVMRALDIGEAEERKAAVDALLTRYVGTHAITPAFCNALLHHKPQRDAIIVLMTGQATGMQIADHLMPLYLNVWLDQSTSDAYSTALRQMVDGIAPGTKDPVSTAQALLERGDYAAIPLQHRACLSKAIELILTMNMAPPRIGESFTDWREQVRNSVEITIAQQDLTAYLTQLPAERHVAPTAGGHATSVFRQIDLWQTIDSAAEGQYTDDGFIGKYYGQTAAKYESNPHLHFMQPNAFALIAHGTLEEEQTGVNAALLAERRTVAESIFSSIPPAAKLIFFPVNDLRVTIGQPLSKTAGGNHWFPMVLDLRGAHAAIVIYDPLGKDDPTGMKTHIARCIWAVAGLAGEPVVILHNAPDMKGLPNCGPILVAITQWIAERSDADLNAPLIDITEADIQPPSEVRYRYIEISLQEMAADAALAAQATALGKKLPRPLIDSLLQATASSNRVDLLSRDFSAEGKDEQCVQLLDDYVRQQGTLSPSGKTAFDHEWESLAGSLDLSDPALRQLIELKNHFARYKPTPQLESMAAFKKEVLPIAAQARDNAAKLACSAMATVGFTEAALDKVADTLKDRPDWQALLDDRETIHQAPADTRLARLAYAFQDDEKTPGFAAILHVLSVMNAQGGHDAALTYWTTDVKNALSADAYDCCTEIKDYFSDKALPADLDSAQQAALRQVKQDRYYALSRKALGKTISHGQAFFASLSVDATPDGIDMPNDPAAKVIDALKAGNATEAVFYLLCELDRQPQAIHHVLPTLLSDEAIWIDFLNAAPYTAAIRQRAADAKAILGNTQSQELDEAFFVRLTTQIKEAQSALSSGDPIAISQAASKFGSLIDGHSEHEKLVAIANYFFRFIDIPPGETLGAMQAQVIHGLDTEGNPAPKQHTEWYLRHLSNHMQARDAYRKRLIGEMASSVEADPHKREELIPILESAFEDGRDEGIQWLAEKLAETGTWNNHLENNPDEIEITVAYMNAETTVSLLSKSFTMTADRANKFYHPRLRNYLKNPNERTRPKVLEGLTGEDKMRMEQVMSFFKNSKEKPLKTLDAMRQHTHKGIKDQNLQERKSLIYPYLIQHAGTAYWASMAQSITGPLVNQVIDTFVIGDEDIRRLFLGLALSPHQSVAEKDSFYESLTYDKRWVAFLMGVPKVKAAMELATVGLSALKKEFENPEIREDGIAAVIVFMQNGPTKDVLNWWDEKFAKNPEFDGINHIKNYFFHNPKELTNSIRISLSAARQHVIDQYRKWNDIRQWTEVHLNEVFNEGSDTEHPSPIIPGYIDKSDKKRPLSPAHDNAIQIAEKKRKRSASEIFIADYKAFLAADGNEKMLQGKWAAQSKEALKEDAKLLQLATENDEWVDILNKHDKLNEIIESWREKLSTAKKKDVLETALAAIDSYIKNTTGSAVGNAEAEAQFNANFPDEKEANWARNVVSFFEQYGKDRLKNTQHAVSLLSDPNAMERMIRSSVTAKRLKELDDYVNSVNKKMASFISAYQQYDEEPEKPKKLLLANQVSDKKPDLDDELLAKLLVTMGDWEQIIKRDPRLQEKIDAWKASLSIPEQLKKAGESTAGYDKCLQVVFEELRLRRGTIAEKESVDQYWNNGLKGASEQERMWAARVSDFYNAYPLLYESVLSVSQKDSISVSKHILDHADKQEVIIRQDHTKTLLDGLQIMKAAAELTPLLHQFQKASSHAQRELAEKIIAARRDFSVDSIADPIFNGNDWPLDKETTRKVTVDAKRMFEVGIEALKKLSPLYADTRVLDLGNTSGIPGAISSVVLPIAGLIPKLTPNIDLETLTIQSMWQHVQEKTKDYLPLLINARLDWEKKNQIRSILDPFKKIFIDNVFAYVHATNNSERSIAAAAIINDPLASDGETVLAMLLEHPRWIAHVKQNGLAESDAETIKKQIRPQDQDKCSELITWFAFQANTNAEVTLAGARSTLSEVLASVITKQTDLPQETKDFLFLAKDVVIKHAFEVSPDIPTPFSSFDEAQLWVIKASGATQEGVLPTYTANICTGVMQWVQKEKTTKIRVNALAILEKRFEDETKEHEKALVDLLEKDKTYPKNSRAMPDKTSSDGKGIIDLPKRAFDTKMGQFKIPEQDTKMLDVIRLYYARHPDEALPDTLDKIKTNVADGLRKEQKEIDRAREKLGWWIQGSKAEISEQAQPIQQTPELEQFVQDYKAFLAAKGNEKMLHGKRAAQSKAVLSETEISQLATISHDWANILDQHDNLNTVIKSWQAKLSTAKKGAFLETALTSINNYMNKAAGSVSEKAEAEAQFNADFPHEEEATWAKNVVSFFAQYGRNQLENIQEAAALLSDPAEIRNLIQMDATGKRLKALDDYDLEVDKEVAPFVDIYNLYLDSDLPLSERLPLAVNAWNTRPDLSDESLTGLLVMVDDWDKMLNSHTVLTDEKEDVEIALARGLGEDGQDLAEYDKCVPAILEAAKLRQGTEAEKASAKKYLESKLEDAVEDAEEWAIYVDEFYERYPKLVTGLMQLPKNSVAISEHIQAHMELQDVLTKENFTRTLIKTLRLLNAASELTPLLKKFQNASPDELHELAEQINATRGNLNINSVAEEVSYHNEWALDESTKKKTRSKVAGEIDSQIKALQKLATGTYANKKISDVADSPDISEEVKDQVSTMTEFSFYALFSASDLTIGDVYQKILDQQEVIKDKKTAIDLGSEAIAQIKDLLAPIKKITTDKFLMFVRAVNDDERLLRAAEIINAPYVSDITPLKNLLWGHTEWNEYVRNHKKAKHVISVLETAMGLTGVLSASTESKTKNTETILEGGIRKEDHAACLNALNNIIAITQQKKNVFERDLLISSTIQQVSAAKETKDFLLEMRNIVILYSNAAPSNFKTFDEAQDWAMAAFPRLTETRSVLAVQASEEIVDNVLDHVNEKSSEQMGRAALITLERPFENKTKKQEQALIELLKKDKAYPNHSRAMPDRKSRDSKGIIDLPKRAFDTKMEQLKIPEQDAKMLDVIRLYHARHPDEALPGTLDEIKTSVAAGLRKEQKEINRARKKLRQLKQNQIVGAKAQRDLTKQLEEQKKISKVIEFVEDYKMFLAASGNEKVLHAKRAAQSKAALSETEISQLATVSHDWANILDQHDNLNTVIKSWQAKLPTSKKGALLETALTSINNYMNKAAGSVSEKVEAEIQFNTVFPGEEEAAWAKNAVSFFARYGKDQLEDIPEAAALLSDPAEIKHLIQMDATEKRLKTLDGYALGVDRALVPTSSKKSDEASSSIGAKPEKKGTNVISLQEIEANKETPEGQTHSSRRSSTASTLTISEDMSIQGDLSKDNLDFIRRRFGKDILTTPVPNHVDTLIHAKPLLITDRGTVIYHQFSEADPRKLSDPPLLYEITLARLKTLGRGDEKDIQARIDNPNGAVRFLARALTGHIDHYQEAKRNAAAYEANPSAAMQMTASGDLSAGDHSAIEHEFKDRKDVRCEEAPANDRTLIKGIPFHLTARGTVLYRIDADMVDKDPKKREVVEVTIGRLQAFAGVGSLSVILDQIKHRQHATIDVPPVDQNKIAALREKALAKGMESYDKNELAARNRSPSRK